MKDEKEYVDWDEYGQMWIEILSPHLRARRERNRTKRKVFNLNSLLVGSAPKFIEFEIEDLNRLVEDCPYSDNINKRIVSCIVGIKG